jgi:hypothetical protein
MNAINQHYKQKTYKILQIAFHTSFPMVGLKVNKTLVGSYKAIC